jgi:hypothetical protein
MYQKFEFPWQTINLFGIEYDTYLQPCEQETGHVHRLRDAIAHAWNDWERRFALPLPVRWVDYGKIDGHPWYSFMLNKHVEGTPHDIHHNVADRLHFVDDISEIATPNGSLIECVQNFAVAKQVIQVHTIVEHDIPHHYDLRGPVFMARPSSYLLLEHAINELATAFGISVLEET